jgi:hypothetical protein
VRSLRAFASLRCANCIIEGRGVAAAAAPAAPLALLVLGAESLRDSRALRNALPARRRKTPRGRGMKDQSA